MYYVSKNLQNIILGMRSIVPCFSRMHKKLNVANFLIRGIAVLAVVVSVSVADAQKQEPFVYDDRGKRDPLWQLVSPSGVILNYETDFLITDLSLEGIMAGKDGKNYAIINGRILKAKDTIGQFVVEQIDDNRIVLKKGKQKFELKLTKDE